MTLCCSVCSLYASSPVSFMSAEGKGEVSCYFLKVFQGDIAVLALVVVFHYGLQGATEESDSQSHFLVASAAVSSAFACPVIRK